MDVVWGSTRKPGATQALAQGLEPFEGTLFIGYPIIPTPDGPFPIDALWISRERGLIAFNCVEENAPENYDEIQDDTFNILETKLRAHKNIMRGRKLLAEPQIVTFAPRANLSLHSVSGYPLCNLDNLQETVEALSWDNPQLFEPVTAIIQSITSIRKKRSRREITKPGSKGEKLQKLEDSIANLDLIQGRAVIETFEGVQRIRGLAGSGKTIVLALKAAYLHAQHPDWDIAVTFYTRSLKEQFRRLITTFAIEQTGLEPDWGKISVLNAWGAPGGPERNGVYYNICLANEIPYRDFQSARDAFGQEKEFEGACEHALGFHKNIKPLYDAILIDEAQDFPIAFLRLCYEAVKDPRRLVYAYDELQSLSERSLPGPESIFGKKPNGQPKVQFLPPYEGQPRQDIILEKCYRNSRPILTCAHALGFGIYREPDPNLGTGLIQMFDQKQLWFDVGYALCGGRLEEGLDVCLKRTPDSSPPFLEISPLNDIIAFRSFENKQAQAAYVCDEIVRLLNEEELAPDDIIVINPNPMTTRKEVGPLRKTLFDKGIQSHLAGVDTSPDVFFDSAASSVPFTGIFRAKGNEAGMVFVVNAQDCYDNFGRTARVRNQLFTAITRSKAWIRVLGVGARMEKLCDEFDQVRANDFQLRFTYPTERVRKRLNVVNRDMSAEERKSVQNAQTSLASLLEGLENGTIQPEDIPEEQLKRLQSFLR